MAELPRSASAADRNLLFGILALQMDFISRDQLVAAMNAWVLDKAKPLGQVLLEQGALAEEQLSALETLVKVHVKQHGNDPEKSLAALGQLSSLEEALAGLKDHDLQASLGHLQSGGVSAPAGTVDWRAAGPNHTGPRFRILRPHARGGLGEVFVAEDQELHREVALKEIQSQRADEPESRSRFLMEAEITGGLEHPGIVPVYGLGSYGDGRPYYAMRFIRGDSLKEAITQFHANPDAKHESLALRQLLRRFTDVCNAMAYAHSRGVLHRDLKPGNIMLGKYGETLVVDWGLAKTSAAVSETQASAASSGATGAALDAETPLKPASGSNVDPTQMGRAIGTPAYMSPEQAAGRLDELSPASDVYSLGATLYMLLVGKPAFGGEDMGAVLRQVQKGAFPTPRQVNRQVPPALEAICLKAMARAAGARYTTPRALADDIEHWLADEPVAVYREALPARLRRWSRRHKALVSAAVALLLTAVVGLAVGLVAVDQEQRRTQKALVAVDQEQGRTQQALAAEQRRRQQARQALDAMSSAIIDEWLGKQKELLPEHRAFLEQALRFYEEFAQETAQDEEARTGVAAASMRVSGIYNQLGQASAAEAGYRQSAQLYRLLAADFDNRPEFRLELARSHNDLGKLLKATGRLPEAETAYRDALALKKQLAADFPDRPDYRLELARSQNSLGILMQHTHRLPEAEAAYRDALTLKKQLAADFPNQPDYRFELVRSQVNLAVLMQNTNRPKEAETAYRDALALQKQLIADFPNRPDYRFDLAKSQLNLGVLLIATGRPQEGETAYRDALTLYKQLAADFPNRPDYRYELAGCHSALGILLNDTGRLQEAETAYRGALALLKQLAADFPNVPDYQAQLGNTLEGLAELANAQRHFADACRLLDEARLPIELALRANPRHSYFRLIARDHRQTLAQARLGLGEHAAAAAAAEEMLQIAYNPVDDAYNAGCVLAQCVPLADKDAKIPEAKRKELAQSYADRAMALLRQAVAAGYKNAAAMKKDTNLDALRSRDDFKKLLADLETKAATPRK